MCVTVLGTRKLQGLCCPSPRSCSAAWGGLQGRAAGSYWMLVFLRHKRRTTVAATQRRSLVLQALQGGHRMGCGTNRPFFNGVSFCQLHGPLYNQKWAQVPMAGGADSRCPTGQWPWASGFRLWRGDGDHTAIVGFLWGLNGLICLRHLA